MEEKNIGTLVKLRAKIKELEEEVKNLKNFIGGKK